MRSKKAKFKVQKEEENRKLISLGKSGGFNKTSMLFETRKYGALEKNQQKAGGQLTSTSA